MTSIAADCGNQTLVTDLVHELSSELEIPFLLNSSSSGYGKDAKCNELLFDMDKHDLYDGVFYVKEDDSWLDQDILLNTNSCKFEVESVSETDDFQTFLKKNDSFKTYLKTDSSGHGSGSDSSSTELWTVKSERDASPVTPPEERTSPDNIIFFPSDEIKFIPISQEGCRKNKQNYTGYSRTVKIQPKPNVAVFNGVDNQICSDQTVMCNVFKDVQTELKCSKNGLTEDIRSTILFKKDSEVLQAKRKQERMIRNRESAYLSRKRKKEYVAHLEKQVQDLVKENNKLRQENLNLKERLMKYENVESHKMGGRTKNVFFNSPRKTTALLAVMLTICLNIGSFSNFIKESQSQKELVENNKKVPFHMENIRHVRSLLWSDPQFDDLKSLANLSKTSCPINQSESIRLESELRRWIRGDEDFSGPRKRNANRTEDYLLKLDRVLKHSGRSKRKNRIRKTSSPPSDVEVDVFRMKSHFLNFDTFFEAIHRRDDTFYLVSFSADHLLLPALAHNKTSRPKMSVMLPAFLSNTTLGASSDQVEMMQIDCEVTNTKLLSVNENDIPTHMRPYSNSTNKHKNSNSEETGQFSQFFVEDLVEKKSAGGSVNGSLRQNARNFFFLKRSTLPESNGTKFNAYKLAKLHSNFNFNQTIKEREDKVMVKNDGYFFDEKAGGSANLSNESNGDGDQFLDSNGKGFLKSLMVPSLARNLTSGKKINLKTAMKFSLP